MFAFFKSGLKAACGFLRNRENHTNPFSIFIWVDETSPAWWDERRALNFYEILSHLTASSVASEHPEQLLNPQQPFRDFSYPLLVLPKTFTIQSIMPSKEMLLRLCAAHTAAELSATLGQFLCCLPFQASLSQPFHQLFHHRFCINPAALHKQPGSWLRKKQSSEKCSRTRTSQEFWKSVFTKRTNKFMGLYNFQWKNTWTVLKKMHLIVSALLWALLAEVHQTFINKSVRLNLLAPKVWA